MIDDFSNFLSSGMVTTGVDLAALFRGVPGKAGFCGEVRGGTRVPQQLAL